MCLAAARRLLVTGVVLLTVLALPLDAATLRRGLGPEPDSLHIHQARGLAAINLLRDLREGLVTFDERGEPAPGQAASWQVSDDGRLYRFVLRPDARWSTGETVVADDFVRGWRRAFSQDSAAATAELLKDIRHAEEVLAGQMQPAELGIRAVSPDVLEIELERPAPWILEILAHPIAFPLHAEGMDDPRGAPVNGPYFLHEWTPRASIQLLRNAHYHGAASVALDRVEYYPIEEPATELALYRAGQLHMTETIPPGRFSWLQENLAGELRVYPYLGSFWLGFNLKHPVLGKSRELRKALALAIDREILVRTVLGSGERIGWSIVPPGIPGYTPSAVSEAALSQEQRESEARRLFGQTGLGDVPVRLELRYNTSAVHRRVAVAVAAMWKQVLGIGTELVNEEWKVFVNNRTMGVVTEVFRGGWIADYADPSSFLDLFVSGSSLNHTFYSSVRFDNLLGAAAEAAGDQRMELLRRAEHQLLEDMPAIPLYQYVSRHLVSPAVTGYEDNVRDIHLSRYLDLQ